MEIAGIRVGESYKINGRTFRITEELEVGPATAKYISRRLSARGLRGAEMGIEIRNGGSAFWYGITSHLVEEISTLEAIR